MNRQKRFIQAAINKYERESSLYYSLILDHIDDLFGKIDEKNEIQKITNVLINTNLKKLKAIADNAQFIFNNSMSWSDRTHILESLSKMNADQIRAVGINSQTLLSNINSYCKGVLIEVLSIISGEKIEELSRLLRQGARFFLHESIDGYSKTGLIKDLSKLSTKKMNETFHLIEQNSDKLFRDDMTDYRRTAILKKISTLTEEQIKDSLILIYENGNTLGIDKAEGDITADVISSLLGCSNEKVMAIVKFIEKLPASQNRYNELSRIIFSLSKSSVGTAKLITNKYAFLFLESFHMTGISEMVRALSSTSHQSIDAIIKNSKILFGEGPAYAHCRATVINALSDQTPDQIHLFSESI
ncbi:MAG TPA: hypothetical protein DD412_03725 [Holosporales bacterium]|nr:hypothetical protein [Holosporales bacterium]